MGKPILPESIREDIKILLMKGYSKEAVAKFVGKESQSYISSEKQLERCIVSIERIFPDIPKVRNDFPVVPRPKEFDPVPYSNILAGITKRTPLKEIEDRGARIAKKILKKYEKFENISNGPSYAGTPFDLFGFKNKKPYIIELKASLSTFNYPGEIQKKRMQDLLRRIKGLHVALIQIKLKEKPEYKIFYDNQMDLLFYGSKMPLGPIENWIRVHSEK